MIGLKNLEIETSSGEVESLDRWRDFLPLGPGARGGRGLLSGEVLMGGGVMVV